MNWQRYKTYTLALPDLNFSIDISRVNFPENYFEQMEPHLIQAYQAMDALEKGAIANPDEQRQVGHYWLRHPQLAPTPSIQEAIQATLKQIHDFTGAVHAAQIQGRDGRFEHILLIGIGGSALGPQFVSQALGQPSLDKMHFYCLDNTDPDGIDCLLERLHNLLGRTLVIVTSKSGGTPETRNGMLEIQAAYQQQGLDFGAHAVAVTGPGSLLHQIATQENWLACFPIWDFIGGRTSELSAVGLLPAALQGIDIDGLLEGARAMDEATRKPLTSQNPAAWLALMWYFLTEGKGKKDMVILPYKDRLMLFSKYLQQLVMESLGKEKDLDGRVVHQGIAVYGNKGSTDQHAYVQQLRDGIPNFFVTFIEVLEDRAKNSIFVEEHITCGDYLQGLLLGTKEALSQNGRQSITLTVPKVSPEVVGQLIALYERAVGFYAHLIHINAYHQPGVEAGKKAASAVLKLKTKLLQMMLEKKSVFNTAEGWAHVLNLEDQTEAIFKLLEHMAVNRPQTVKKIASAHFFNHRYGVE